MSAIWALFRRNLGEARWLLLTLCFALFGLSWLFVFATHRNEVELHKPGGSLRRAAMLRGMGGPATDLSTGAIEVSFWGTPLLVVPLVVVIWAISRGSTCVAGEIERGTLDMILSRPITRFAFLGSQVLAAIVGFLLLALALLAGHWVGAYYNSLRTTPTVAVLVRPLLNLVALGFAVYGYAALCSTLDLVRWRPTLLASGATLAGFIVPIIANLNALVDNYKWLENCSIFKAYNPVEAVVKGDTLAFNAGILGLVGTIGLALGVISFLRRDLPANS